MKKLVLFIIAFTSSHFSQQPVVLQPWMQVEGTYNGQRLGSQVGFAGKINDSTKITASDINGINMYHVKNPNDTVPRFFFSGHNCSLGDFNGDGIRDLLVSGNPTKIYLGISEGVFDTIPFFVKHQEPEGDTFGRRVAVGKINGDLYDDLIITDDFYPNGLGNGRVYIFFGGIDMDTIPNFILDGYIRSRLGFNITTGDLNNDGYDDIIVKGHDFNAPSSLDRFPYIKIFLGANTIDTTAWKCLKGTLTTTYGIASFDVNGDGIDDLLWTDWNTQSSSDYVRVHFSNGDIDTIPSLILKNPGVGNPFGDEIKNAGDMNGDGYNDVLVNAFRATSDAGFVFIFSGGPNMDENFDAAVGIGGVSDFGYSMNSVGDINGNGCADIVIGAPKYKWFSEKGYWGIFLGDTSIPVTSVKEEDFNHPRDYALFQNFPNPFNPNTTIQYKINTYYYVSLEVFNVLGEMIRTLEAIDKPAGEYTIEFDGKDLSSGVYYYKLTLTDSDGNKQSQTKSMVLIK